MVQTNPDPSILLQRARSGDDAALEDLLAAVQPQLYRFSMRMCQQPEDAEEVLQNSMLAMARSIRQFRGGSSLSTWMYSIARNFCIKQRRRRKGEPQNHQPLHGPDGDLHANIPHPAPDPSTQVESMEVWQQIHTAMLKLPSDLREAVVLRDVEGLTAKQAAEVVGISVSALKSRLHRARADLRTLLIDQPYRPAAGCPDIRRVFSEHLEGDLSEDVCTVLEAHVGQCDSCATECNGLKAALNACSNAPCEVPPDVQRDLRALIQRALHSPAQ